jgi:hypothetical protein
MNLNNETPQEYAARMTQRDDFHYFRVDVAEQVINHYPGDVIKQVAAYNCIVDSNIQAKSFVSQCFLAWRSGAANFKLQLVPK